MTFEEFKSSLHNNIPPEGLTQVLLALWYDGKGDWETSHSIIQDIESKDAALIHAYLHRKEGDIWNAEYWYRRASAEKSESSLAQEWDSLVHHFILNKNSV